MADFYGSINLKSGDISYAYGSKIVMFITDIDGNEVSFSLSPELLEGMISAFNFMLSEYRHELNVKELKNAEKIP